jgi:peptidoglycan endopeptidase LytE
VTIGLTGGQPCAIIHTATTSVEYERKDERVTQRAKRWRWVAVIAVGLCAALHAAAALAAGTYKVKKGDTLWDIARSQKVSVAALQAANRGVRPETLRLGATIVIPGGGASAKSSSYKVRPGDTLWAIARRYSLRVSDLTSANGIGADDTLRLGKVLKIPPGPGSKNITAGLNRSGVCTSDRVSVRLGPGTQYKRAAVIDKGKSMTVTAKQGDWCKVTLAGGTKGWVHSDYVRVSDPVAERIVRAAQEAAAASTDMDEESGSRADDLVRTALSYRGTRYRRGGSSPSAFDCSGFTMYIFGEAQIKLPHSAQAQFGCGSPVGKADLAPGDLVFFRTGRSRRISHVGIAMGDGEFVHASSSGGTVRVDRLDRGYYSTRYVGARRVR